MNRDEKFALVSALISSGVFAAAMFFFLNDTTENPILLMLVMLTAFSAFSSWKTFNKAKRSNINNKK